MNIITVNESLSGCPWCSLTFNTTKSVVPSIPIRGILPSIQITFEDFLPSMLVSTSAFNSQGVTLNVNNSTLCFIPT